MALLTAGGATFETTYARPAEGGEDPAILDRLTQMIDGAPPGAEIRATLFRLTVESVRDALVAASNRGVAVHVVHNGRDVVSEVAATLSRPAPDGLGDGHRWSGPAYDPTGRSPDFGAIATGRNSDLHTKLVLFSATRGPDRQRCAATSRGGARRTRATTRGCRRPTTRSRSTTTRCCTPGSGPGCGT